MDILETVSRYYNFKFWERWLLSFLVMVPVTGLTSCFVGFMMAGEPLQGLAVWGGEALLFSLALACMPEAEIFRKPWWED